MRSTLLFTAITAIALRTNAALPPTAQVSLGRHLIEVNAQWSEQNLLTADCDQPASFTNDAQRIARHLHMVSERLTARTAEGLSAVQLEERLALLRKLDRYADRGLFPQNTMLPYRNPVFIDPIGTACAVGQLMIESGHRDLAERISKEMNLAYVLEMPASPLWPVIAAWAVEHGFAAEELAWIQPAYAPNYPWIALGGGTNGTMTVVKTLANGDLLVAGEFTEAGGTAMNQVAIWNGSTYSPLGAGLQGVINCAVEYEGALYVGGALLGGPSDLAKWDGTSWSFSTVFDGKYPLINALHVHNNELYAAGAMSGFAGTTDFVQKLVGTSWVPVGSAFNAPVLALASHNGLLIAGGAFTNILTPSLPPPALHVAELEGSEWGQHGDGLDATVRTLLDVNGTLYAGGDLYEGLSVRFGFARIGQGQGAWELLLPNHANYMLSGANQMWIGSMVAFNNGIFVGGNFSITYMVGLYGNNVAWFNGTLDELEPMIVVDDLVNGVAVQNQQLIIGGAFDASYSHVASLDLTTGIDARGSNSFTLAPNPATETLRIVAGDMDATNMAVSITDASGRVVAAPLKRGGESITIDVRSLPAGSYHVRVDAGGAIGTQRFLKQ